MEAQHRPESQADTGMAVICEGQWHTRTSHSLGRERQARGGETEIDAEPREAGGRQACLVGNTLVGKEAWILKVMGTGQKGHASLTEVGNRDPGIFRTDYSPQLPPGEPG